jgi:hypothetical protein
MWNTSHLNPLQRPYTASIFTSWPFPLLIASACSTASSSPLIASPSEHCPLKVCPVQPITGSRRSFLPLNPWHCCARAQTRSPADVGSGWIYDRTFISANVGTVMCLSVLTRFPGSVEDVDDRVEGATVNSLTVACAFVRVFGSCRNDEDITWLGIVMLDLPSTTLDWNWSVLLSITFLSTNSFKHERNMV